MSHKGQLRKPGVSLKLFGTSGPFYIPLIRMGMPAYYKSVALHSRLSKIANKIQGLKTKQESELSGSVHKSSVTMGCRKATERVEADKRPNTAPWRGAGRKGRSEPQREQLHCLWPYFNLRPSGPSDDKLTLS